MPTALQIGPENWQSYLVSRKIQGESKDSDGAERSILMEQVQRAADKIKQGLGARRILLAGSLAHRMWWDEDSDVDLAVEGLSGEQYWEAWRIAEQIIRSREVEVIDLDSATSQLLQSIEKEGLLL